MCSKWKQLKPTWRRRWESDHKARPVFSVISRTFTIFQIITQIPIFHVSISIYSSPPLCRWFIDIGDNDDIPSLYQWLVHITYTAHVHSVTPTAILIAVRWSPLPYILPATPTWHRWPVAHPVGHFWTIGIALKTKWIQNFATGLYVTM